MKPNNFLYTIFLATSLMGAKCSDDAVPVAPQAPTAQEAPAPVVVPAAQPTSAPVQEVMHVFRRPAAKLPGFVQPDFVQGPWDKYVVPIFFTTLGFVSPYVVPVGSSILVSNAAYSAADKLGSGVPRWLALFTGAMNLPDAVDFIASQLPYLGYQRSDWRFNPIVAVTNYASGFMTGLNQMLEPFVPEKRKEDFQYGEQIAERASYAMQWVTSFTTLYAFGIALNKVTKSHKFAAPATGGPAVSGADGEQAAVAFLPVAGSSAAVPPPPNTADTTLLPFEYVFSNEAAAPWEGQHWAKFKLGTVFILPHGKLTIDRCIGGGKLGMVYEVTINQQICAMKVVGVARGGAGTLSEEAITLKALSGIPGIPQFYGTVQFGDDPNDWAIFEELGRPVKPGDFTSAFAFEALSALAAIHERGFYHNDISQGNLVVSLKGGALVIDFGITAKAHRGRDSKGELADMVTILLGLYREAWEISHPGGTGEEFRHEPMSKWLEQIATTGVVSPFPEK